MKKIAIVIFSVFLLTGLTGCNSEPVESSENNKPSNVQEEKISIIIYENDNVKVEYVGKNFEDTGLNFNVYNKTSNTINFAFDSIAINGKTEHPVSAVEIIGNTYAEYICDVSTLDGLEVLTANMYTYDEEGYTIEEFNVNQIPLKED